MSSTDPTSNDPRLAEGKSSWFTRFASRTRRYKGLLEKLGALSIIAAAAQYFFTYGERVEERQNKDMDVIRQIAILSVDDTKKDATKGFLGISGPLARLTRDCGKKTLWRLPLWYFERDCVDLPSLKVEHAELGGIVMRGANLSQGSFHCSNLRGADFSNANLAFKWLGGSNLAYANFSGAKFSYGDRKYQNKQFWFANLTGATFSEDTDIDPEALLCGCVSGEQSIKIDERVGSESKFAKVKEDLKKQQCIPNVCGTVFLESASDSEKAKTYKLSEHCAAGG